MCFGIHLRFSLLRPTFLCTTWMCRSDMRILIYQVIFTELYHLYLYFIFLFILFIRFFLSFGIFTLCLYFKSHFHAYWKLYTKDFLIYPNFKKRRTKRFIMQQQRNLLRCCLRLSYRSFQHSLQICRTPKKSVPCRNGRHF